MHVEACLALAMADTYRPSPLQPWFGIWTPPHNPKLPPDEQRKPLLIYGAGKTKDEAIQSALVNNKIYHKVEATTSQITIRPAQDPNNPLWRTMLGEQSTPNQIAQGIAIAVAVGLMFDRGMLATAIAEAIDFCYHQLKVGMMSVKHGANIISEFKPISHLWIWYLAYSYLRWIALRTKDSTLTDLTFKLWQRLIADMIASGTPDGYLLCCGPRAWSRPDPNKPAPKKFSFQSAAADCIYRDILLPSLRVPDARLRGSDMLGAMIVRDNIRDYDTIARGMNNANADPLPLPLPTTIDRIAYAHGPGCIATWLHGARCSNMTRPGPVWWSVWMQGEGISYGVNDDNANEKYGLYPISDSNRHPALSKWNNITFN